MPAPPEVVYDEWLDPEALAEWMCPLPARATRIECQAWIGGALRSDIDDRGAAMTVTGRYLELRRPHRLSFTWYCTTWAPSDPESLVTVTFEPYEGDRTLMTIEHAMLRPDLLDRHEQGWTQIADQLAGALARRAGHRRGSSR
jgi:uncharacterized protein YndB with AHSA1/START domain